MERSSGTRPISTRIRARLVVPPQVSKHQEGPHLPVALLILTAIHPAAAYAAVSYFCGAAAAQVTSGSGYYAELREKGTEALTSKLVAALDSTAQAVFHVTLIDDSDPFFGHEFTLHVAPDGVQIYQRFIREFTLQEHLLRTPPLDDNALKVFLGNLALLEAGGPPDPTVGGGLLSTPLVGDEEKPGKFKWTAQLDDAYSSNFGGVRLSVRHHKPKKTHGVLSLAFYTTCVVAPFIGTAADASADGHSAAFADLMPATTHFFIHRLHALEMTKRARKGQSTCALPHGPPLAERGYREWADDLDEGEDGD